MNKYIVIIFLFDTYKNNFPLSSYYYVLNTEMIAKRRSKIKEEQVKKVCKLNIFGAMVPYKNYMRKYFVIEKLMQDEKYFLKKIYV